MPPKKRKTERHETKGDRLLALGRPAKALKEYKMALKTRPESVQIYDKIMKAHDLTPGKWGVEDFTQSVLWAMKKQELEHPPIKQVHARLSPEWDRATRLAVEIMRTKDKAKVNNLLEDLVAMGETATRALIGMLMDLKDKAESDL